MYRYIFGKGNYIMKKIVAFLMIVLMAFTFVSCDLGEDVGAMYDEMVQGGADALGDFLKEDPSWSTGA